MKRKITSFVALVLSLMMAVPMLADQQSLTGIGDYVTVPEAGKNYVIQGNAQHDNLVSWLYDNNGTTLAADEAAGPRIYKAHRNPDDGLRGCLSAQELRKKAEAGKRTVYQSCDI